MQVEKDLEKVGWPTFTNCLFLRGNTLFLLWEAELKNATHCNNLQVTATHCNTLQHTATHCDTLQHTCSNWTEIGSRGFDHGRQRCW